MRILLVNHYAGSPAHGMEFRPYYLAREWVRAGHEVLIVAASYSHVRAVQPEMQGLPREEQIRIVIPVNGTAWRRKTGPTPSSLRMKTGPEAP